jgi:hypothetical protein
MTAAGQPEQSTTPGIIPQPVHIFDDAAPPTPIKQPDEPKPGPRNPVRLAVAKVMSALRGDKYMVDAYPAAGGEASAASEGGGATAAEG